MLKISLRIFGKFKRFNIELYFVLFAKPTF